MKSLVVLGVLFGSIANASYLQKNCGNADGSVQVASGHSANVIVLTERTYSRDGVEEIKKSLSYEEAKVERVKEVELDSSTKTSCGDNQHDGESENQMGIFEWQNISAEKVQVAKTDGSSFSKNTVGVSEDGKTVSAYLICDESGNSMTICPKKEAESNSSPQEYACMQTVNCMPVVSEEMQKYCTGDYLKWAKNNCDEEPMVLH